jgi:hypothetical protein
MLNTSLTRSVCVGLAILVCGVIGVRGQATVEYSALGDNIRNPDGSLAPVGEAVRFGFFPSGFNFGANQTFSSLNSSFTQLDSTTINAGAGHFDDTGLQTLVGQQFYIWALNSTPATLSSATGWVILTNPNWVLTSAQLGDTGFFDTSDVGTVVPTGALGHGITSTINNPAGNQTDWVMDLAAVPEPSSVALAAIGLVAVGAVRRLRKR